MVTCALTRGVEEPRRWASILFFYHSDADPFLTITITTVLPQFMTSNIKSHKKEYLLFDDFALKVNVVSLFLQVCS